MLGEWDVGEDPDCAGGDRRQCQPRVQRIQVEKVVKHPRYSHDQRRASIFFDIALVRLKKEARLNGAVQLACLPLNKNEVAARMNIDRSGELGGLGSTVVGWGHTENYTENIDDFNIYGAAKRILQKASLPVISNQQCKDKMGDNRIGSDHLCARGEDGGADSCKGDSGGGLFIQRNTTGAASQAEKDSHPYLQVGIVSFGTLDCGIGKPGVYTRVKNFTRWIHDNLEP